jgi:hypothetical protein
MSQVLGNKRLDVLIKMYDVTRDSIRPSTGDCVLFFTGGLISVLEGAPDEVADIIREDIAEALKMCNIAPMLKRYNTSAKGAA